MSGTKKWTNTGTKSSVPFEESYMPNLKLIKYFVGSLSLVAVTCGYCAEKPEVWNVEMKCGKIEYKIQSNCIKSLDETTLNKCEPQKLFISTPNHSMKAVQLPNLSEQESKSITGSGGEISDLFVTKWACGKSEHMSVAVLYYSIGGGSAPYSEAISIYDESGKIVQNEKSKKYKNAFENGFKNLVNVRSIMPD